MNEIKRLEREYEETKQAAHDAAIAAKRLTFLLPDRCIAIKKEIKRLRSLQGPRRGTSMVVHVTSKA